MASEFASIGKMIVWAEGTIVQYLDNDDNAPYVFKDGLYHYYSLQNGVYTLFCTSERDLGEKQ